MILTVIIFTHPQHSLLILLQHIVNVLHSIYDFFQLHNISIFYDKKTHSGIKYEMSIELNDFFFIPMCEDFIWTQMMIFVQTYSCYHLQFLCFVIFTLYTIAMHVPSIPMTKMMMTMMKIIILFIHDTKALYYVYLYPFKCMNVWSLSS